MLNNFFYTLSKNLLFFLILINIVSTSLFSQEVEISINAVGDTVPGTNFMKEALPPDNGDMLFSNITSYLKDADVVFGNFESTMTNYPTSRKRPGNGLIFAFRTPPKYANSLKTAGFDILSIANNHSFDFFEEGFKDTAKNIEATGVLTVGQKNEIKYLTKKNIRIAFIAFGYTPNFNSILNLEHAKSLVIEAQKKADIIVISAHMGSEGTPALHVKRGFDNFHGENRGDVIKFSRTMIDTGADLILGHGPHVPRAIELYKNRFIAYSLGNFLGYRVFSLGGAKGLSLILKTNLNKQGEFISGKIIPLYLNATGIPHYDEQKRSIELIQQLTTTDFPNTNLQIGVDGSVNLK